MAQITLFCYNKRKYASALISIRTSLEGIRKNPRMLLVSGLVLLSVSFLGIFFFQHSRFIMQRQIEERMRTAATLGALQFDAKVLERFRDRSALEDPQFRDVVIALRSIRESVPGIRYAYIMRKTRDPRFLEFVADADALSPDAELDQNRNGKLDEEEEASFPGDIYDVIDAPTLQNDAFLYPSVDAEPTVDQWGSLVSGYAPIYDDAGRPVAVLGIDMDTREFYLLSQSIFSPVALLLVLLVGAFIALSILHYVWRKRIEALRELDRARTALLNLTVHQLGAPIATFKWWLEILRERYLQSDKEVFTQIDEGLSRMGSIMQAINDANKVKEKTLSYQPELTSLKEVLEHEVQIMQPILDARQQKAELQVHEGCPATMRIDPKLVGGVLHELLDNAMTYSQNGKTITVRATCSRSEVLIEVQDEGYGISLQDQEHLFEKFSRGAKASLYKPVGNGLGLFTAKGVIEQTGGRMWVESEEGEGSRFFFTLPLR